MGWSKVGCGAPSSALISAPRSERSTHISEAVPDVDPELLSSTERRLAKIGRYLIRGQLGSGGMGRVYRAHDLQLQRDVAIKVIRPTGDEARARSLRERFGREGRALARLAHPTIVGVLEVGQQDGMPYLVMDYVPGRALSTVLEETGPLSHMDACRIARKIALALHHAHKASILHRDVKPGNIILRPTGEPLLIDFGLARDEGASTTLTCVGARIGTLGFAAPEQLRGDLERVGRHSDIYGLGATLFALLTGEVHDPTRPTPLRELMPHLPPELADLCDRCLAEDPAARPSSAIQVANVLARLSITGQHAIRQTLADLVDEDEQVTPRKRPQAPAPRRRRSSRPARSAPQRADAERTDVAPTSTRELLTNPLVVVLASLLVLTLSALLFTYNELNLAWAEADRERARAEVYAKGTPTSRR